MLRGFEYGKVGPKDGDDFIGGNYLSAINIASTLPQILPNAQNINFSLFLDAANLWGVDYDSSINDSNKIRSTVGIGVDWFTAIGPLNFTFSENISKDSSDITESFRFNIGTTF
jgi:outer membrane protein insertion porin family